MKKKVMMAVAIAISGSLGGAALAALNPDGTMTLDEPAAVWPERKLSGDGTKSRSPVTFNHERHGAFRGCAVCHHKETQLKAGDTEAKSCFECHGRKAVGQQLDSYEVIHGRNGTCVFCHKTDTTAQAARAPSTCPECHVEKK